MGFIWIVDTALNGSSALVDFKVQEIVTILETPFYAKSNH